MAGVGVGTASGFALQGQVDRVGTARRDPVARRQRAVAFDHGVALVAILDMHRAADESIADLLVDESLDPFLDDGFDRQDDLLLPSFDGDQHFHPLPGPVLASR